MSSAILAFAIWDAQRGDPASRAWPPRYAVPALALAGCLITGIDLAPRHSTERKVLRGLSVAALVVAAAGLVMRFQG